MGIVFFSTKSIGDIFFAVPFINFICSNNKNVQFYIYTNLASYLYKDIQNLTLLDKDDNPHHHPIRFEMSNFFQLFENHNIAYHYSNIYINTWVAALNKVIEPINCECSSLNIYNAFQKIISSVNETLETKITFPEMKAEEMIYKMPPLDIEQFLAFKLSRNRKTIYYHNRSGVSANTKPFKNDDDHIYVLQMLLQKYPNIDFIVPNAKAAPKHENIFITSTFGVVEDHTCQNVLKDIDIAGNCDFAIVFDIGSCLLYCNDRFSSYKATFIHASHNDRYPMLMKKNLEDCLSISTNKIEYLHAKTPDELLIGIQSRVK